MWPSFFLTHSVFIDVLSNMWPLVVFKLERRKVVYGDMRVGLAWVGCMAYERLLGSSILPRSELMSVTARIDVRRPRGDLSVLLEKSYDSCDAKPRKRPVNAAHFRHIQSPHAPHTQNTPLNDTTAQLNRTTHKHLHNRLLPIQNMDHPTL